MIVLAKKKHFVIFGFFGEIFILDYVINTKTQILHAKLLFSKNLYLSTKASLQPKKGLNIFSLKFKFLLLKKMHIIQF